MSNPGKRGSRLLLHTAECIISGLRHHLSQHRRHSACAGQFCRCRGACPEGLGHFTPAAGRGRSAHHARRSSVRSHEAERQLYCLAGRV